METVLPWWVCYRYCNIALSSLQHFCWCTCPYPSDHGSQWSEEQIFYTAQTDGQFPVLSSCHHEDAAGILGQNTRELLVATVTKTTVFLWFQLSELSQKHVDWWTYFAAILRYRTSCPYNAELICLFCQTF